MVPARVSRRDHHAGVERIPVSLSRIALAPATAYEQLQILQPVMSPGATLEIAETCYVDCLLIELLIGVYLKADPELRAYDLAPFRAKQLVARVVDGAPLSSRATVKRITTSA